MPIRRRTGVAKRVVRKKTFTRKVKRIVARIRPMCTNTYRGGDIQDVSGTAALPYIITSLSTPSVWQTTFATTTLGAGANTPSVLWSKMFLDMRITVFSLETPCVYTMFLVSLKNTGNQANLGTMTNGLEYSGPTASVVHTGQCVILNPKYFNIHRTKRFTLTPVADTQTIPTEPTQGGNPFTTYKRITWTIYPKKRLRNPVNDWTFLTEENLPATSRYYVIIFHNNQQVTKYNRFLWNAMYDVKTPQ